MLEPEDRASAAVGEAAVLAVEEDGDRCMSAEPCLPRVGGGTATNQW